MQQLNAALLGRFVCQALRGAWRAVPAAADLHRDCLDRVAANLFISGAGGLAWQTLRCTQLAKTATAQPLRKEYRANLLRAAAREQQIKEVVALFRRQHIEPIVVKGWASARCYAIPGLRPYGDIDVCIPPEQVAGIQPILLKDAVLSQHVDLHAGIPDLRGRTWDDAFARSRLATIDSQSVRILCPEDHLRLICLHLVRHVLERPLWLCDVAAAVEALPADFDWDYCLHGDAWLADWVLCAVGLAQQLLGAEIRDAAIRERAGRFAGWVVPYVHWTWGNKCRAVSGEWLNRLSYQISNPVRWSWRLGRGPTHSFGMIQTLSVLNRPWQLLVRIQRQLHKRHSVAQAPFDLHVERTY